jgi:hypothetical protein
MLNSRLKCDDIDKFEVINLGVGGYDIEYIVERFIKRGIKYNPDFIIWPMGYWNYSKILEYIIPIKTQKIKEGIPYQIKINNKVEYQATKDAIIEFQNQYPKKDIINYHLSKIDKFLSYDIKTLYIFYSDNIRSEILTIIESIKLKAPTKNHHLVVNISNGDLRLADNHPNKYGHEIIANDIYNYLITKELSNCRIEK